MPLTKDSREFIECLRSNGVEFLIVGALAVAWHGFPRYSGDIDFWVRPSRAKHAKEYAAGTNLVLIEPVSTMSSGLGKKLTMPSAW